MKKILFLLILVSSATYSQNKDWRYVGVYDENVKIFIQSVDPANSEIWVKMMVPSQVIGDELVRGSATLIRTKINCDDQTYDQLDYRVYDPDQNILDKSDVKEFGLKAKQGMPMYLALQYYCKNRM